MATKRRYFVGALMITALSWMFLTIFSTRGGPIVSSHSQSNNSVDLPIVDYDVEINRKKSKIRKEKDARLKGLGNSDKKPIAQLPDGVELLPISGHWWQNLSAVPMDQSDVVILGNVFGREAHLSDDRTGIYSEFTLHVDQVFRDTTSAVFAGSPLVVNRTGGGVRFASGKIQKYGIAGQGMPRIGSHYVLFLRKTPEGDLLILTGYELSNGQVTPLDGEEKKDPRSDLPFAKYRGAAQATFLKEVRDAATRAATGVDGLDDNRARLQQRCYAEPITDDA